MATKRARRTKRRPWSKKDVRELRAHSGSARAGRFQLANGRHLPYQKLGVKPPRPYAPRW
jgi:hypothetical protein